MLDSYYSGKFTDHVNDMDITDEQKYNLKVANKLAQGEKDANGKTIANSKARAVADAYRELGLLDEVLDYIKKYDVAPSEMGLSKTVYKELMNGGDTSYLGAYSKTSKSKSSSGKKSSGSKKKSSKKRSGGSITNKSSKTTGRMLKISNPGVVQINRPQEKNKQYLSAYANVMKRGPKNVSSGEGTSTCPRCHNRVVPVNGKCPICGANM